MKKAKAIISRPIGIIRSGHKVAEKTPIQPLFAKGCRGVAIVYPEYAAGLTDIEGFSHVYLIYHFHKARRESLVQQPFLDEEQRGVFACRHPGRPNRIGMSLVELVARENNELIIDNVDILDGTPLLDIKPFHPKFDAVKNARTGWIRKINIEKADKKKTRSLSKRQHPKQTFDRHIETYKGEIK